MQFSVGDILSCQSIGLFAHEMFNLTASLPASTRALYERKLRKLLQSDGHGGAENSTCYSDGEEELESHKESGTAKKAFLKLKIQISFHVVSTFSGLEPDEQEIIEVSESQQGSRQVRSILDFFIYSLLKQTTCYNF